MGHPRLSDEALLEALHTYKQLNNNESKAAEFLGLDRRTFSSRLKSAQLKSATGSLRAEKPFKTPDLPDSAPSAEELLRRRKFDYERVKASKDARKLINVPVDIDGPIGIVHMGDPHVDDDGTDIGKLEEHVKVINRTEGLFGANLGDISNNWIGRLARLYGEQSTSEADAWVLTEWLVSSVQWLYLVGGNHDCLDMETEVLTRRGWLMFDGLSDSDEILSLDPETGKSVWMPIQATVSRPHDGEMISIETRTISALVTPNHRILHKTRDWRRRWRKKWEFCAAENLSARFALPVSGSSGASDFSGISDDEIRFAGWVLTDGGIQHYKNSPRITIYQSKCGAEIERILSTLDLEHRRTVRRRTISEICGRQLIAQPLPQTEYVLNAAASRRGLMVVPEKGKLPEWADAISDRQFDVLLDALIAGDGCWDGGDPAAKNVAVLHGTFDFLSSVQSVAVHHGWRAFISKAREKDYRLNLCRTSWLSMDRSDSVEKVQYNGRVWCLTTPLSNFMVRRNGKTHFTGNCWSGVGDPLKWIAKQSYNDLHYHGVRLNLCFPNTKTVRVNARHDFAGHSMWNPAHGPMKAVQGGWRDHILTCGHKHVSFAAGPLKDPASGLLSWAIRCAGYKTYDRYAEEKGLPDQNAFAACVTIIDPQYSDDDPRLVTVICDVNEGADYLRFKRKKK